MLKDLGRDPMKVLQENVMPYDVLFQGDIMAAHPVSIGEMMFFANCWFDQV